MAFPTASLNASLKRIFALAGKELYVSFHSPVLYGAGAFFTLSSSIALFYIQRFFTMNTASLRPYFAFFPLVYALLIPALTMKSWADERKSGGAELLLTMPFSEGEIVLGKYLASLGILGLLLLATVPLPLSLLPLGKFNLAVIAGEYLGAAFLGAAAAALGHLLSALAKSQAGAFLGTAATLLAVMLIPQITQTFTLPETLAGALNFCSPAFHFESFSRGILDSRDLAYFIITSALFLYLNARTLFFRRWK